MPKRHTENIYYMDDEELFAVMEAVKRLAGMIKTAVKADGINIIMNNEPAAGQIIFHSHVHIVPRFSDDGYKHWKGKHASPPELEETAKKIKEELVRSVA